VLAQAGATKPNSISNPDCSTTRTLGQPPPALRSDNLPLPAYGLGHPPGGRLVPLLVDSEDDKIKVGVHPRFMAGPGADGCDAGDVVLLLSPRCH
jgi:hypothetical protein